MDLSKCRICGKKIKSKIVIDYDGIHFCTACFMAAPGVAEAHAQYNLRICKMKDQKDIAKAAEWMQEEIKQKVLAQVAD